MKTLITEKCIREIVEKGEKVLCIDDNTLITPAAKDIIRENGIEVTTGCAAAACAPAPAAPAPQAAPAPAAGGELNSDMIYQVLKGLADRGMLDSFVSSLTGAAASTPYVKECDNGFKIARGSGIKMEVLDTGVQADYGKVQYQELIGADDGSSMNAGFMTVDHCTFDWDVEPQEIYYVVEGNMTVTVEGRPHTAYPGDCLFIQKGSKVVFSSGDTFFKVFYCTY